MAYIVQFSDNSKVPIIVADESVNSLNTSLSLLGKNYLGYGEIVASNLVKLLEHCANTVPPINAIEGQLWFDTANQNFKYYDGSAWQALIDGTVDFSDIKDYPPNGEITPVEVLPLSAKDERAYIYSGSDLNNNLPHITGSITGNCQFTVPSQNSLFWARSAIPRINADTGDIYDGTGSWAWAIPITNIRSTIFNQITNVDLFEPVTVGPDSILTFRYVGEQPMHVVLSGHLTFLRQIATETAPTIRKFDQYQHVVQMQMVHDTKPSYINGRHAVRLGVRSASAAAATNPFRLIPEEFSNKDRYTFTPSIVESLGEDFNINPPLNGWIAIPSGTGLDETDINDTILEPDDPESGITDPELQANLKTTDWIPVNTANYVNGWFDVNTANEIGDGLEGTGASARTTDWIPVVPWAKYRIKLLSGDSNRRRIQWKLLDGSIIFYSESNASIDGMVLTPPENAVSFRAYYITSALADSTSEPSLIRIIPFIPYVSGSIGRQYIIDNGLDAVSPTDFGRLTEWIPVTEGTKYTIAVTNGISNRFRILWKTAGTNNFVYDSLDTNNINTKYIMAPAGAYELRIYYYFDDSGVSTNDNTIMIYQGDRNSHLTKYLLYPYLTAPYSGQQLPFVNGYFTDENTTLLGTTGFSRTTEWLPVSIGMELTCAATFSNVCRVQIRHNDGTIQFINFGSTADGVSIEPITGTAVEFRVNFNYVPQGNADIDATLTITDTGLATGISKRGRLLSRDDNGLLTFEQLNHSMNFWYAPANASYMQIYFSSAYDNVTNVAVKKDNALITGGYDAISGWWETVHIPLYGDMTFVPNSEYFLRLAVFNVFNNSAGFSNSDVVRFESGGLNFAFDATNYVKNDANSNLSED